jgi:uncharacterized Rmd1/YagE family protein
MFDVPLYQILCDQENFATACAIVERHEAQRRMFWIVVTVLSIAIILFVWDIVARIRDRFYL